MQIAVNGALSSTGQRCTASSRLVAVATMPGRFVEQFIERTYEMVVGHALAPKTQVGPVACAGQLQKNLESPDIPRG